MSNRTSHPVTSPTLPDGYTIHVGIPPIPVYRNLRSASGLTPVTVPQAAGAVSGSWYGCHVRFTPPPMPLPPHALASHVKDAADAAAAAAAAAAEDLTAQTTQSSAAGDSEQESEPETTSPVVVVGMGRIISDGGWYFHIADMAVLPEHQRKGLGAAIIHELLGYIELARPQDGSEPYISLFADPPGRPLYLRHEFVDGAELGEIGMVLVKKDGPGGGMGGDSEKVRGKLAMLEGQEGAAAGESDR